MMDKRSIAEDLYQLGILTHTIIDEGLKTGECKCILPNIGLYEKYGFRKIGDFKTIYGWTDQLFYMDI